MQEIVLLCVCFLRIILIFPVLSSFGLYFNIKHYFLNIDYYFLWAMLHTLTIFWPLVYFCSNKLFHEPVHYQYMYISILGIQLVWITCCKVDHTLDKLSGCLHWPMWRNIAVDFNVSKLLSIKSLYVQFVCHKNCAFFQFVHGISKEQLTYLCQKFMLCIVV